MSKLIKQFQTIFNNTTVNQNRVDASVKIANNHAIEFTEWVRGNYLDIFPFWLEEKSNRKYTTEQLLEIYNKK
jgi:hypothetical protein